MYKISEEDKKIIAKIRTKVEKQYPGCCLSYSEEGYTIEDSEGTDILSEYFLPLGKTPIEAWQLAALTAKTTQNFNRTHPERLSLEMDEEKLNRIARKRTRD